MYLKNLTVLGFKSFADKTSLNFQPGVTAIVGPNGCGKSNVSDAIRWVLGEQSAKALRGGEMADVIFNGTDGRKPMGMAEVSLTIGDVEPEQFRAAGIPVDFNEITITRRVFRDGGSDYFLNRTACRLRDIQQLFAGTGIGKTSYSVMAQGNITQILSSKPDDRRLVFEEAAGITRFKQQKREALRKLDATDQNLLRVQDLMREVKRQLGSLQRQAGKARRYRSLQTELQTLETQLAKHQYDILVKELASRTLWVEQIRLDMGAGEEEVLRLEDEIGQLREQLGILDHQLSEKLQTGLELKSQIDRHGQRVEMNQERLRELDARHEDSRREMVQGQERRLATEDELRNVTERWEAAQIALKERRSVLDEKRVALQAVEAEMSGLQEALRKAQSQAFASAQTLSRVKNETNALDVQKQGNIVRLEKLRSEQVQLEEERVRLEERLETFHREFQIEQSSVETCRGTLAERQARLKQLQLEMQTAGSELDVCLRRQAEKRSRLQVLQQLETQHEGFGQGALAALKASPDVLGSLTDRIRVPDSHVAAVETALGHHLQLVLAAQPEVATGVLAELAQNKKGRASIAALALVPLGQHDGTVPADVNEEEAGQPLVEMVQANPDVAPLIRSLLGRTRLVADLGMATKAAQRWPGVFDYVTATGEMLTCHGVLTGGGVATSGKAASSILGRKNQIAELEAELAELQAAGDELSRKKGAFQSEQVALQASLEQARTELRQQEVAVATRQGEVNALQNSRRSLEAKAKNVEHETRQLEVQVEEGERRRATMAGQVSELEEAERQATEWVQTSADALEAVRGSRDEAASAVSDSKVTVATEEQLCVSYERQRGPLEQRLREWTARIEQMEREQGSFTHRRAQFEQEIGESQSHMERLQHEREAAAQSAASLQEERATVDQDLGGRDSRLREVRAKLTQQQTQAGHADVEIAQKTMARDNLVERMEQKYQIQLAELPIEGLKVTVGEDEQVQIEVVPVEEFEAGGSSTDWDAVSRQVGQLQRRVDEIGPVNLVAIEEHEETEQRHEFLNNQYDDLVKAKAELVDVINRINTETKSMFLDTFEKIRTNFQTMFVEIFGGGKADLRLVDDGDVLESGIEIVARPPGKQLQSITLLSGGEQTMTAVSLLFAIYQVKPSPFCVLDELDAPLDESNINRFVRVLQRFIEHSQFIVITHNKRTIAMADVLYGVTMQEHGVSRIVSVRFNDSEGGAIPAQTREEKATTVPELAEETMKEGEPAGEVVMAK